MPEKVTSEQYISVFEDGFHHNKRIATNFRRGLNITLPDNLLSSIYSWFLFLRIMRKNHNGALTGILF